MKRLVFVTSFLFMGLMVGCAPTVSQAQRAVTLGGNELDPEPTLARPNNTPAPALPATLAPTNTPANVPTLTPISTAAPASTNSPTPLPTALAAPTITLALTNTLTAEPSATLAPASPIDNAASEEVIAYGLKVYTEQYCGVCHRLDAADTAGMFGPTHNHFGTVAEGRIKDPGYTGQATTAAEYIRESIVDPGAYYVAGYEQSRQHMPAFTHLSEAELNALVQMLLQQK
jgi:mono/diheme cytochrome c family protein